MEKNDAMLETSIRNSGFSALLCCILGLILFETWLIRVDAKLIVHIIAMSLGMAFSAVAYRGIAPYYTVAAMPVNSLSQPNIDRRSHAVSVACAGLLVIFGYAGGMALSSGWLTFFAAFAWSACVFPWSGIGFCRTRILVPAALVIAAMVPGMLRADQLPHPFFLPLAAWMLWCAATGAWLRNIIYRHRKSKASKHAAGHRVDEPAGAINEHL